MDGEAHYNERRGAKDHVRTIFLNDHGIKVLRFENWLVFQEREFVLNRIEANFGWWKETD